MEADKYIALRKYLHQNPELSGKEVQTTQYLFEFFKGNNFGDELYKLGDVGLLVKFNGENENSPVLIRCELDGLPILEENEFKHKSKTVGVSHKCGHDGHMAIVTRLAELLHNTLPKGDVYLLYQPAEEIGEGANWVVNNTVFKQNCHPEYVFALHNLPGTPLHSISVKPFDCTPSVISIDIDLKGKTSHAAEPQNGYNPAYLVGELQAFCLKKSVTDPKNENFQIITPIYIEVGKRDFGIAPGAGRIGFTLRTKNNKNMAILKDDFIGFLNKLSNKYKVSYSYNWTHEFTSIYNDKACAEVVKKAANDNDLKVNLIESPFPWGEDFGVFTSRYKGAMFGLGAGENCPALHNSNYDFPDKLIISGSQLFDSIIREVQK